MPDHGPKDYMDHQLFPVCRFYYSNLPYKERFGYMNVAHDLPEGLMGQKMHPGQFQAANTSLETLL